MFSKKDTGRLPDGSQPSMIANRSTTADARLSRRNATNTESSARNASSDRHDISLLRPLSSEGSRPPSPSSRYEGLTRRAVSRAPSSAHVPTSSASPSDVLGPSADITPYLSRRGLPDRPLSPSRYRMDSPRRTYYPEGSRSPEADNFRSRYVPGAASTSNGFGVSSIWFWAVVVVFFNLLLLGGFLLSFPDSSLSSIYGSSRHGSGHIHDDSYNFPMDTTAARSFLSDNEHVGVGGKNTASSTSSSSSSSLPSTNSSAGLLRPFPTMLWREVDTLLNQASADMGILTARFGDTEDPALVPVHSALTLLTRARASIVSLQTTAQIHAAQALVLGSTEKDLSAELAHCKDQVEAQGEALAEAEMAKQKQSSAWVSKEAFAAESSAREQCEIQLKVAKIQLESSANTSDVNSSVDLSNKRLAACETSLLTAQQAEKKTQLELSLVLEKLTDVEATQVKAQAELASTLETLSKANGSVESCEKTLAEKNGQLTACRADLTAAKEASASAASAAAAAASGKACETTLAEQQAKYTELLASNATTEARSEIGRENLRITSQALEECRNEISRASLASTAAADAAKAAEIRAADTVATLTVEQDRLATALAELAVAKAAVEKAEEKYNVLDTSFSTAAAEAASVREEKAACVESIIAAEKAAEKASANVDHSRSRVQTLESKLESCRAEADALAGCPVCPVCEEAKSNHSNVDCSRCGNVGPNAKLETGDAGDAIALAECIEARNVLMAEKSQLTERLEGGKAAHELLFTQLAKEVLHVCNEQCAHDQEHHHHDHDHDHSHDHDHDHDLEGCLSKCKMTFEKQVSAHNAATAKLSSEEFNPVSVEVIPSDETLRLRAENLEIELREVRLSLEDCLKNTTATVTSSSSSSSSSASEGVGIDTEVAQLLQKLREKLSGDEDGWQRMYSRVDRLTQDVAMANSAVSEAQTVLQLHAEKARLMQQQQRARLSHVSDPLARFVSQLSNGPLAAAFGDANGIIDTNESGNGNWIIRSVVLFLVVLVDLVLVQLMLPRGSRFLTFLVVLGWAAMSVYCVMNKFWTLNILCAANTVISFVVMISPRLALSGTMKNNLVALG